ncbi:MAG: hypothetical protein LBN34_00410 [Clostridiales Family XIII bacterium]|nr:hypothetical protein [Clostridiales Family XIII bacterium]
MEETSSYIGVDVDTEQTLEGTYRTDQTPPTGLGTELTFTADGTVTDNTGDGDGTYKIEGDKLTITYQGVKASYTFSSEGNTITLNYVRYVSVDDEDEAYEPYTPSADDPYPGLIVGTIPAVSEDRAPYFVVDVAELESYARQNLEMYEETWDSLGPWDNPEEMKKRIDSQTMRVDPDETGTSQLIDDGATTIFSILGGTYAHITWKKEYGAVFTYGPVGRIYFESGNSKISGSYETNIYYSGSMDRILTQQEYRQSELIDESQARELWPDDYAKYAQ